MNLKKFSLVVVKSLFHPKVFLTALIEAWAVKAQQAFHLFINISQGLDGEGKNIKAISQRSGTPET